MDWIGCGSEYTWSLWIGLDWVNQLVDWVGLDLAKWTHAKLCFVVGQATEQHKYGDEREGV